MAKVDSIEKPQEFIDVDLSVTERKKIRISGDNTRVVELNLSDMLIVNRLDEQYKKLQAFLQDAQLLAETTGNEEDDLINMSKSLKEIDSKMRECIDAIFDYPVCAVCAPEGSMYDPFGGTYRFEYIIEALSKLYENNLNAEYKKMSAKVNNKVQKYMPKKK